MFDPKFPQHGLHLGSTLANKPQLRPNPDPLGSMPQLGPKLGLFGLWPKLRPTCLQNGGDMAKTPVLICISHIFLGIDDTSWCAVFHMLCLRWAALRAKMTPKGPKLPLVEYASHSFSLAQLQPNVTNWLQLGLTLGPRCLHSMFSPTSVQTCPSCPSWAQVEVGANWPEFGAS
jgi:hypothetical protein